MKKIFVILTVISLVSFSAMAQEESVQTEKTFEATGKYSVEANFEPANIFEHSNSSMFSMPSFKLRIFNSANTAYRVRFQLNVSSSKDETGTEDNFSKSSLFYLMVAPGYEKHFGQGRLRPYYGFEVPIAYRSTSTKDKDGDITTKTKNANDGGYLSLGLNGIFGLDFYVYKTIFIGAEFAPGFSYRQTSDAKVEGEVSSKGGSSFAFNTSSYSGLKIGYRF